MESQQGDQEIIKLLNNARQSKDFNQSRQT
jgi:hypothetical protein